MTAALPTLGPPGVYLAPDLASIPPLGVRMDVCAFVGVTPRGPAWERVEDEAFDADGLLACGRARTVPVAVESWAEYVELFGGFEGPGLLPWSVAGYFAQGGQRAYISRVVPARPRPTPVASPPAPVLLGRSAPLVDLPASEPAACAVLAFDPAGLVGAAAGTPDISAAADPVWLRARNEGSWGNRLTAVLSLAVVAIPAGVDESGGLALTSQSSLARGELLRVRSLGAARTLRTVLAIDPIGTGWVARLNRPITGEAVRVERVTATLQIVDADPAHPRSEQWTELGLRAEHPRWLGDALAGSRLVELAQVRDAVGIAQNLIAITPADLALPDLVAARPSDGSGDGVDRYELLAFDDVLGPLQVLGASSRSDGDLAPDGLDALASLLDPPDSAAPASIVVADLYEPFAAPVHADIGVPATVAGADFDVCVTLPAVAGRPPDDVALPGLRLDPSVPADRTRIVELQRQVVAAAQALGLVALLDVPPGLRPAQVLAWRSCFGSSSAAAWHGWLRVPNGDRLQTIAPTGNAAGLIAWTERTRGLATGPALSTLVGAVAVAEGAGAGAGQLDTALLGRLHRAGINVCLPTRDGVQFSAARTLAADASWRQLTVRRVVTMVERSVAVGLDWAAFEPNDGVLRERISTAVGGLLGALFAEGAFAGATPAESYFVRIASPAQRSLGGPDLLCEIGLAPSEPTEFLLVRVLRADDGTLQTVAAA